MSFANKFIYIMNVILVHFNTFSFFLLFDLINYVLYLKIISIFKHSFKSSIFNISIEKLITLYFFIFSFIVKLLNSKSICKTLFLTKDKKFIDIMIKKRYNNTNFQICKLIYSLFNLYFIFYILFHIRL